DFHVTGVQTSALPILPYTDDKKLAQILCNFISNALKFTPQGRVSVSARPEGERHVRFSVRDTGIGIPEHMLGALFEDFVQVDSRSEERLVGKEGRSRG